MDLNKGNHDVTAEPADQSAAALAPARSGGALAPLRNPTFRMIWIASLFSNFGSLIQGVGAAWEMTRLTSAPEMVALVQTAMMVPLMLVTVPAGAMADLFDRRTVAIMGLLVAIVSSAGLTAVAASGLMTPWVLLLFCMLIGTGTAIFAPAWQASISEQVGSNDLPAAVALGAVSYNVARSFGPAIGGAIVVAAGATAAFGVNAVSYFPLLLALTVWKRPANDTHLPSERLDRAIVSGLRFVRHSKPARTAAVRAFVIAFAGASLAALTPLIAKNLLGGDASTYGVLLGAYGVGAVLGALTIGRVRTFLSAELLNRICGVVAGFTILAVALSSSVFITCVVMVIAGAAWIVMLSMLNVGVQLSSPRWVTARALAWYQAALTGGVALGAWMWGHVTAVSSLPLALIVSAFAMMLTPLLGVLMPLSSSDPLDANLVTVTHEPEVNLPITTRSGPVVMEIDYRVTPEHTSEFSTLMIHVQSARQRNGAFDWSLSRDIANPDIWTERYQYPTWGDYLRQRTRSTEADYRWYRQVSVYRVGSESTIRRKLERQPGALDRSDEPPTDIIPPQAP